MHISTIIVQLRKRHNIRHYFVWKIIHLNYNWVSRKKVACNFFLVLIGRKYPWILKYILINNKYTPSLGLLFCYIMRRERTFQTFQSIVFMSSLPLLCVSSRTWCTTIWIWGVTQLNYYPIRTELSFDWSWYSIIHWPLSTNYRGCTTKNSLMWKFELQYFQSLTLIGLTIPIAIVYKWFVTTKITLFQELQGLHHLEGLWLNTSVVT